MSPQGQVLDSLIRMVYSVHMTTDTTAEPDLSKLEKIRALLDKAESTAVEFPQEAEALSAKAIEMMERYRIDEAMIADAAPLQDRGKIVEVRIAAGAGPYVNARATLAHEIARNHSVKMLQSTGYKGKTIYFIGYETDVALTEMLYTSLLVQATRAASSPEVKADKPDYEHGTAFNRAFLMAFAYRIGKRLQESNADADALWVPDSDSVPSRSVALVLSDRYKDVEDDVLRRYGKIPNARPTTASSSWAGQFAGSAAADKADISTNRRVAASRTKALTA